MVSCVIDAFQVTTQDGYILNMQRIPVGQSGGSMRNRPPVLLQHGLFMVIISYPFVYFLLIRWTLTV